MTTLFGYVNGLPELAGRVSVSAFSSNPGTPYARLWDAPGGVEQPYYGHGNTMRVNVRVTVYDKPPGADTTGSRAAAQVRLRALLVKVQDARLVVDTHADGVTPFIRGSFQNTGEPAVLDDKDVAGQCYGTVMFTALIHRP